MTDGDKKKPSVERITEKQRLRYIGFEVFPGKPKDLFKNDADKQKWLDNLEAKREKGEVIREHCTLLEERVSMGERIVLTVASVILFVALLLPWYSAYTEIVEQPAVTEQQELVSDLTMQADSTLLAEGVADSLAVAAGIEQGAALTEEVASGEQTGETEPLVTEESKTETEGTRDIQSFAGEGANEEIITGHKFKKKTVKEYTRLTGFGVFISLGSIGSYVFGSGFILIISSVLMLLYGLACIGLPILNLYCLYGLKGSDDDVAIKLKKYLRFNWLPLILFVVVLFLSFIGADYGFSTVDMFTSIGNSYDPGVLLGTMSWGIFITLAASILVAVKAIEI